MVRYMKLYWCTWASMDCKRCFWENKFVALKQSIRLI